MLNVIKVRLYPTKSQQSLIHQHFGSCRLVYNLLLDAKIKAFECNDNLSIYDLKKRLVPMKNVNPKNSSLTCSCCDNIDKKSRKTQAKFEFTKCGFKANADYNASLNILKR